MGRRIVLSENGFRRLMNSFINEDVLGNDWREVEEPIENRIDRDEAELEFINQHDWGVQGEENIDPTFYEEEDPSDYKDDIIHYPNDNELYNYGNW